MLTLRLMWATLIFPLYSVALFVFNSTPASSRIEIESVELWQGRRLHFMSAQNGRIQNYLNESEQYFSP
jgi:hypothetical protein